MSASLKVFQVVWDFERDRRGNSILYRFLVAENHHWKRPEKRRWVEMAMAVAMAMAMAVAAAANETTQRLTVVVTALSVAKETAVVLVKEEVVVTTVLRCDAAVLPRRNNDT